MMKKDGRVRICVDYRDLNKASPKDDFPLPHIDVLVDSTAGFELFSFMDGFSGYNQIRMKEVDKEKTTFITPWGTFHYKVMPFGLKNAGATYQRAMKLFDRLREFKLRLNPTKCVFGATSGKLLGFIVNSKGIEIDPAKAKAICELQPPSTVKEVRSLLGKLNYIARFISQLSETAKPFFKLLKKNARVNWDDECREAFNKLKQYLMNPPVLLPPSPGHPLILYLTIHKFDVQYMPQKSVKGRVIADLLAENPEVSNNDDRSLDDRILSVNEDSWTMFFDGASTCLAEYEACILGLQAVIEMGVPKLKVFGDSALIILQTVGEWKTKDAKLLPYHKYLEDLIKEFDEVSFEYLSRSHNQFADALATLSPMLQVTHGLEVEPLKIEVLPRPAYCMVVTEESDGKSWYYDIMNYIQKQEFPEGSTSADRKYIMKMASKFFVSGENLYKRSYDSVLLRCVGAAEATQIMQLFTKECVAPI
ncbi:uncharacterized protein LOC120295615 [Eucalyptus grandis]|uniref:uncharacterized protein LOC120295615 n=1 Tax=Eucalyptus grandis TaxID=71139 RepID=UPI00192E8EE5|nr:uncharacterized protein LOC120295615 [Eucalyptus grandis]